MLLPETTKIMNAHNDLDYIAFFETMPANRIEIAVEMEANRMINSRTGTDCYPYGSRKRRVLSVLRAERSFIERLGIIFFGYLEIILGLFRINI